MLGKTILGMGTLSCMRNTQKAHCVVMESQEMRSMALYVIGATNAREHIDLSRGPLICERSTL